MNTNKMNPQALAAAVAAIVTAVKAKGSDGEKARQDGEKAISQIRDFAKSTAEADAPLAATADYLSASLVAAGIKGGTARPYAAAYRGFRHAIAEGKDIIAFTKQENGSFKPMTAPEARSFGQWAEMTPAQREQAEATAELDSVRAEIGNRIKAINDKATLEAFRDQLPEVEDESSEAKTETAAQKAIREAKATAEALLGTIAEGEASQAEPAKVAAA